METNSKNLLETETISQTLPETETHFKVDVVGRRVGQSDLLDEDGRNRSVRIKLTGHGNLEERVLSN